MVNQWLNLGEKCSIKVQGESPLEWWSLGNFEWRCKPKGRNIFNWSRVNARVDKAISLGHHHRHGTFLLRHCSVLHRVVDLWVASEQHEKVRSRLEVWPLSKPHERMPAELSRIPGGWCWSGHSAPSGHWDLLLMQPAGFGKHRRRPSDF